MYLKLQIEQCIENNLKDYVFGYRKGRTMENLRDYVIKSGVEHVLHLDMVKYFDRIDKERLFDYMEEALGIDKNILVKIRRSVSHTDTGLPQGNVLSPILSNTYLIPFDELFPNGYARFSDDLYFSLDMLEEKDSVIRKVSAQ
jgi:retron-type reverse transcriptase